MSNLLDQAIAAHGGWTRWQQRKALTAHISATGGLWNLKGLPGVFADATVSLDPHRQHVEYAPFISPAQRGIWEPELTRIVAGDGHTVVQRASPRAAFDGHSLATGWDAQHALYFGGYAAWTYLTTPFLLKMDGVVTEEIAPWDEHGETWRRLKAVFPPGLHSHSPEQVFYFDAAGILRRHDYSVDVMGGTASANYASDCVEVDGFVFPTRRKVYAIGPDNRPLLERLALAIHFSDIHLA